MLKEDCTGRIAVVIPVYGALDYARRCLESLARASPAVTAIVIDDGTPDAPDDWWQGLSFYRGVQHSRFSTNYGLTAAWNEGVRIALRQRQAATAGEGHPIDTIVLGNSDLLFPQKWWEGIHATLMDPAVAFCGPMTNAPGNTKDNLQDVRRLLPEYEPRDGLDHVDATCESLVRHLVSCRSFCCINGFCMAGHVDSFLHFAYCGRVDYSEFCFFPPEIKQMPSGRLNPTPRMTGQEDWLNRVVRRWDRYNAAACGSFVFHYRSASRGDRHKGDKAFRPQEQQAT